MGRRRRRGWLSQTRQHRGAPQREGDFLSQGGARWGAGEEVLEKKFTVKQAKKKYEWQSSKNFFKNCVQFLWTSSGNHSWSKKKFRFALNFF